MAPLQGKGRDPELLAKRLRAAHRRLATVTNEDLPNERFIAGYNRPQMLFYLDPPYWGHEGLFERADFERLAGLLKGLKGRFILSLNDVPEIREIFAGFAFEEVEVSYTTKPGWVRAKELIIRN